MSAAPKTPTPKAPPARVRISLALQGGGAHGAFTWGVLDRLLAPDGPDIAAISGTSAGALNGAAVKTGMVAGGRAAAQERLRRLWTQVAGVGDMRVVPWVQPFLPAMRFWQQAAQSVMPISPQAIATQFYSPYAFGEAWKNPLEPVIRAMDFAEVCADEAPALFVGATNVRTGKARVFTGHDVTPEALMASACLPTAFQAVEIDGEAYWDGGYTGNPSLWPLYDPDLPDDIVIVQVNPMRREEVPKTPVEIDNREDEISFNASLLAELRAIAFVHRLIAEGRIEPGQMKDVRVHIICDDGLMTDLSAASKLEPSAALLDRLFAAGHAAADRFLAECGAKIGRVSSVDLSDLLG